MGEGKSLKVDGYGPGGGVDRKIREFFADVINW